MSRFISSLKKVIQVVRPWNVAGVLAAQGMTIYNLSLEPKTQNLIWFLIASAITVIAGHIIRDIKDYESDQINEPEKLWIGKRLSLEEARYLYWTLFFLASVSAFMISVEAYFLFTVIQLLQFVNAVVLKQLPIVGNFLMSGVVVYAILIVPETFDAPISDYPWPVVYIGYYILFLIELVSDIRSVKGDTINKRLSIPVLLGKDTSLSILWVLILLPTLLFVGGFIYFTSIYWQQIFVVQEEATVIADGLILSLVVLPISYLSVVTYRARIGKHSLYRLQNELKFLLVLGMLYWGIGLFSANHESTEQAPTTDFGLQITPTPVALS